MVISIFSVSLVENCDSTSTFLESLQLDSVASFSSRPSYCGFVWWTSDLQPTSVYVLTDTTSTRQHVSIRTTYFNHTHPEPTPPFGIPLASVWRPFGIPLASVWHLFGIPLASVWHPFGVGLQLYCSIDSAVKPRTNMNVMNKVTTQR